METKFHQKGDLIIISDFGKSRIVDIDIDILKVTFAYV